MAVLFLFCVLDNTFKFNKTQTLIYFILFILNKHSYGSKSNCNVLSQGSRAQLKQTLTSIMIIQSKLTLKHLKSMKSVVFLVFLLVSFLFSILLSFLSVIQFVNSRRSSLMLNHHSITKLIISLTLTLLQCYFLTL